MSPIKKSLLINEAIQITTFAPLDTHSKWK